jgi:hypothetical protein
VRTTKTTLRHGVAIKPFDQTLRDFVTNQPFALKDFILYDGLPTSSVYVGNLQICNFGFNPSI